MAKRFDMAEHEKRMLALLKPKGVVSSLEDKIRETIKKRRLPQSPSRSISSGV